MKDQLTIPNITLKPKLCQTAAGCLIYKDKVLLVKHKKLGYWLNPGGHVDEGELMHQAAEREYFEETGVKVEAIQLYKIEKEDGEMILPVPFVSTLTWVSPENYQARMAGKTMPANTPWKRGCEQHVYYNFLVKPVGKVELVQNPTETDGIQFFTQQELEGLDMPETIKKEVRLAFQLYEKIS